MDEGGDVVMTTSTTMVLISIFFLFRGLSILFTSNDYDDGDDDDDDYDGHPW